MAQSFESLLKMVKGKTPGQVLLEGVLVWMYALSASVAAGIQAMFDLLILPLKALGAVMERATLAFFGAPLNPVEMGAAATAQEVSMFGLFALPVSVIIVLGTFAIYIIYYQWGPSPDWFPIPGVPDLPTDFFGVDEDEEGG